MPCATLCHLSQPSARELGTCEMRSGVPKLWQPPPPPSQALDSSMVAGRQPRCFTSRPGRQHAATPAELRCHHRCPSPTGLDQSEANTRAPWYARQCSPAPRISGEHAERPSNPCPTSNALPHRGKAPEVVKHLRSPWVVQMSDATLDHEDVCIRTAEQICVDHSQKTGAAWICRHPAMERSARALLRLAMRHV